MSRGNSGVLLPDGEHSEALAQKQKLRRASTGREAAIDRCDAQPALVCATCPVITIISSNGLSCSCHMARGSGSREAAVASQLRAKQEPPSCQCRSAAGIDRGSPCSGATCAFLAAGACGSCGEATRTRATCCTSRCCRTRGILSTPPHSAAAAMAAPAPAAARAAKSYGPPPHSVGCTAGSGNRGNGSVTVAAPVATPAAAPCMPLHSVEPAARAAASCDRPVTVLETPVCPEQIICPCDPLLSAPCRCGHGTLQMPGVGQGACAAQQCLRGGIARQFLSPAPACAATRMTSAASFSYTSNLKMFRADRLVPSLMSDSCYLLRLRLQCMTVQYFHAVDGSKAEVGDS